MCAGSGWASAGRAVPLCFAVAAIFFTCGARPRCGAKEVRTTVARVVEVRTWVEAERARTVIELLWQRVRM